MLINSDNSGGYFVIILSLLLGFMLTHLVPLEKFVEIYVNILVFMGFYSVLVLIFNNIRYLLLIDFTIKLFYGYN